MFPVEIRIPQGNEDALTARMVAMRQWLDHRQYEPSTFRYASTLRGITFLVSFKIKAEAEEFSMNFDGHIL